MSADACFHPVPGGFFRDVAGGVGAPFGGPDETGFDEREAVEEAGDLLVGADGGLGGRRGDSECLRDVYEQAGG